MRHRSRTFLTRASCVVAAAIIGSPAYSAPIPDYVNAAVATLGRPPTDKERDADRRPAEAIAFAGIKPGDKVVELAPGGGYYTRILSKVVGPKGKLYAIAFQRPGGPGAPGAPPQSGGPAGAVAGGAPGNGPIGAAPPAAPPMNPIDAVYRLSRSTEFNNIMPILGVTMAASGELGVPEQVDAVWTSDNYHDFHNKNFGPLDMVKINQSVFRNLKPGGIYLVIDHATASGAGSSQTETLHRIDPETVKKEVTAAGFVLEGESPVLAHAGDDHSQPVFALKGKEDDFLLKFRKPRTAPSQRLLADSEMQPYYGNTLVLGTPDQRMRTIFYHPDHTYQEFGQDGITNGIWYLDVDGNNCMVHQTERAGAEGTVACRPVDFPASKQPKLGDTIDASHTGMMSVALMPGAVYPNAAMPPMGGGSPMPPGR